MSVMGLSGRVFAGPWSAQPMVGVVAEYASNPALLTSGGESETHAALNVESPVYFDADDLHVAVIPRVRYGGNTGYSSLTSNYFHVDGSAKVVNELGTLTLSGAWYEDSSLLYAGELANGLGVRRTTESGDLNWQHALTERWQFQLDGNDVSAHYAQSAASGSLVDYNDVGATPALSYAWNELTTLRILGGVSRYKSLNGFTDSNTSNLQLGWDDRLSELWSVTANAGYSKSNNEYHFASGTFSSAQNGAVYSINLTRTTPQLTAVLSASRALTPTGFAFLSRQDTVSGLLNYTRSERLSFAAAVTWADIAEPLLTGVTSTRRFYNVDLSASWHWTEQMLVTVHLSQFGQEFAAIGGQPGASPASTGLSVQISRQFYQTNQ